MYKLCTDYERMYENIITEGIKYLNRYPKIESMILGVSGGIDSALTLALACEIVKRNQCNVKKVISAVLPIYSKDEEISRAIRTASAFNCETKIEFALEKVFDIIEPILNGSYNKPDKFSTIATFMQEVGSCLDITVAKRPRELSFDEKVRLGNVKARLRMIYLYNLAATNRGLVLSTDNLTESLLGFFTIAGDIGDVGLIQSIWKTEVYGLAKLIKDKLCTEKQREPLRACIEAIPTDGLAITDSDFDQLGVSSYEEADALLIEYFNLLTEIEPRNDELIRKIRVLEEHKLIKRHNATHFKRSWPYNIERDRVLGIAS